MSASAALTRDILVEPGAKTRKKVARPKPLTESAERKVTSQSAKSARSETRTSARKVTRRKARTSQILRDILAKNPDVTEFTVEQIVNSIGESSFGTSLMFFAIPEVVPIPVPGLAAIVVIPTA